MSRNPTLAVLAGLCTLLFGVGLLRLLAARFELGDVYPPYSSLRTDPLGCRALYDALGDLPDLSVERFVRSTAELPAGAATCLLLPGAQPTLAASPREVADLEGFLAGGGRLVIALDLRRDGKEAAKAVPAGAPKEPQPTPDPAAPAPAGAPPRRRPTDEPPAAERSTVLVLTRQWNYGFAHGASAADQAQPATAVLTDETLALPPALPWYGSAALDLRDPRWTPVYAVDGHPVVAQRRLGQGTLVLVADCFLLSNEGLRDSVQPAFVSWLIGPSQRVLFDETHFGIERQRGIMLLVRQYGLHGVLAALAVMALLFVWQSSVRLVPLPAAAGTADATVTGRAADSALRDLLRRHLRDEQLPDACVQAWSSTASVPRERLQRQLERLRERVRRHHAVPRRQRDAVACYRDLCEIVAQKEVPPCKTPPPS